MALQTYNNMISEIGPDRLVYIIEIACRLRATVVQIGGALALVFRGQASTAVAARYCRNAAAISWLGEGNYHECVGINL